MRFLNVGQMKIHTVNPRKAKVDRFGILARSAHEHGYRSRRSTQVAKGTVGKSPCGGIPSEKLVFPRHKFGHGRVLFTMKEGGAWQTWPWKWVPDKAELAERGDAPMGFDKLRNNCMAMASPTSKHDIWVHSFLINGARWDCLNGWTE